MLVRFHSAFVQPIVSLSHRIPVLFPNRRYTDIWSAVAETGGTGDDGTETLAVEDKMAHFCIAVDATLHWNDFFVLSGVVGRSGINIECQQVAAIGGVDGELEHPADGGVDGWHGRSEIAAFHGLG